MIIPDMGPRPVTKVVTQSSKLNASYMLVLDTQGRLTLLKVLSHHSGQVTNTYSSKSPSAETTNTGVNAPTETMFEPIVTRAREHIV